MHLNRLNESETSAESATWNGTGRLGACPRSSAELAEAARGLGSPKLSALLAMEWAREASSRAAAHPAPPPDASKSGCEQAPPPSGPHRQAVA